MTCISHNLSPWCGPIATTLASLGLLFGVLWIVGLIAIWRQPDVEKLLTW